jgi:hypothetical protein
MPGSNASVAAVNTPPICTAGMVAEDALESRGSILGE